jgi:adenosylcobyric acid synthase
MRNIMVQGTSSYAGKTFLVMALCRIFADRGYRVAPFKAQNTSLNSYVTANGGEIARAQALQAMAADVDPVVEMNPLLVKPKGDSTSQLVVNGRPYMDIEAWRYYEEFAMNEGITIVKEALDKLEKEFELLVIEGAGSPAEINLYSRDISNMRVAEMADANVLLAADIDRGGVFASLYGTIALLPPRDRERIRGLVINKFRGDPGILKPGLVEIERRTRKPVLGVVPYIHGLQLPGEDSLSIRDSAGCNGVEIAVIRLPRISNFTDFDPLAYDGVRVRYVSRGSELGKPDAVVIPGTKNTSADLEWLREQGFEQSLQELAGEVPIIGICGGYQMLGKRVIDSGVEHKNKAGSIPGLGLLDVYTEFKEYRKTTRRVEGVTMPLVGIFKGLEGIRVRGYEIHMGRTRRGRNTRPLFDLKGRKDGAISEDGTVMGTYLHGVFDSAGFRRAFLRALKPGSPPGRDAEVLWRESIERAREVVEESIRIDVIEGWLK